MRARPTPLPVLALALLCAALLAGCAPPAQLGPDGRARIAGRTFVVTGASSGLGRGAALKLAAYGGNVVLAARRASVLDDVAREAQAAGGQALVVPTDVSDPAQVEHLAAAAVARFGRVDAWINDAAVAAIGRFDVVPAEDHARVVDVNLKGYIYGSHAALTLFRRQGFGTLVNVSSVEGHVPLAYHASYAATKAAIIALDAALNQELRLSGPPARAIRIVTVEPWAVDTPFYVHAANYTGHETRMSMMNGPWETVDGIVWAAIHPWRGEYPVGLQAEGGVLGAQIWPSLANRIGADVVYRAQFEQAPPAPPTAGAVFTPIPAGTGVDGGIRARTEREDRRRLDQGGQ